MGESKNIKTANIVASGKFDIELDLAAVAEDLRKLTSWITEVEHSRKSGNRLLIYFVDNDALGILSPSGVYVFNGVDTQDDIEDAHNKLLNALAQLGIISSSNPTDIEIEKRFDIRNIVFTADLDQDLDLNTLVIQLGFENTEYEPEQFPAIVYKTPEDNVTMLIFSTGKVVIMGVRCEDSAKKAFQSLTCSLEEY